MVRSGAIKSSLVGLVSAFIVGSAQAQLGAVVANWSAPSARSSSGLHTSRALGDVTNPIVFVGVTPCRIVDTRGPVGPFGGPSLPASSTRNFSLPAGPCSGLPSAPRAYSLNITVTNTLGPGFILLYPTGGSQPLVSTLNYVAGQTIANAAIVPAGTAGSITVVAGVSGTDLIIDINGYFGDTLGNPSDFFTLTNNSLSPTIKGINNSTTCAGACGVIGQVSSGWAVSGTSSNSNGVYGTSGGSGLSVAGVWGTSTNAIGTYGFSTNSNGVWAQSTNLDALAAFGGRNGGFLQGAQIGVIGMSTSTATGGAGVKGIAFDGEAPGNTNQLRSGVFGTSSANYGVLGTTLGNGFAVTGFSVDNFGAIQAGGYLGYDNGTGILYLNGLTGTGTKNFIEPHPTDASKLIKYVSIEGPEAGVYFRGRGRAHHGLATIDVPEDFRMVASEEGLSIQVTPIGEMANVAVTQIDLNRIGIKTSRDVEFFYTVNGVRRAYPTWNPIQENRKEFTPEGPDAKLPAYLSANETQRLIDNGTYNADGTVNIRTAERIGWTRMWAEREAQRQAATAEARKAANANQR